MPRLAAPLAVSPPERLILEAAVASDQIPDNVKKRARVVLMAADGAKNCTIGLDVGMHRSRVIFWRARFRNDGIRGLWDRPGSNPRDPIPQKVEEAIILIHRLSEWCAGQAETNLHARTHAPIEIA